MKKIFQIREKENLYTKYNNLLCFIYYFLKNNSYIFDIIFFLIGFLILVLPSIIIFNSSQIRILTFTYLLPPYKFIILFLIFFMIIYLLLKLYLFYNNYSVIHSSERFAIANTLNFIIYLDLLHQIINNIQIKPEFNLDDYFLMIKTPLLVLSFYIIIKNCLLSIKNSIEFVLIYLTIVISYYRDDTPKILIIEFIIFFYILYNCNLIYKALINQKYFPLILHSFLIINCIGTYYIIINSSSLFIEKELIINFFIFLIINSYFFGEYVFKLFFKPIKEIYFLYPHIEKPYYKKIVNYHGYQPPTEYLVENNMDDSDLSEERLALLSKENEKDANYINDV